MYPEKETLVKTKGELFTKTLHYEILIIIRRRAADNEKQLD